MNQQSASDKKKLKTYTVAILLVLITVTFSGCTDKPEELQDKVNIYVYEQAGQEGDPEKQIQEFYDIALQEAGEPVIKPVAQYAVELDPDTGDIMSIYDPDGNPVDRQTALAMQDDIVRDDAGNIITDPAQLDIWIEKIDKNKYEIHWLVGEIRDMDGCQWRCREKSVTGYKEVGVPTVTASYRSPDNILTVDRKDGEITGGIILGKDGNNYAVMIFDEDLLVFGNNNIKVRKSTDNIPENFGDTYNLRTEVIKKEECTELGGGIYAYICKLPEKEAIFLNGKNINHRKGIALAAPKSSPEVEDIHPCIPIPDELVVAFTDKELLDFVDKVHIEPIGKNKYQILNLKQELPVGDGVWRIKYFPEDDSFDKNLVDNIIKVGDNKDEITGGLIRGNDGNIYGVIIVDWDVFDMYGGNFGIPVRGQDISDTINKKECIDLGGGLYVYFYNLSETPKGSASVHTPQPYVQETFIADRESNGKFAEFGFRKEDS